MIRRNSGLASCVALVVLTGLSAPAAMQRGGGRSGGGAPSIPSGSPQTRLETLEADFKLTKDQKKGIQAMLDEAHKRAAPLRESLASAHAALGRTAQSGESEEAIDTAAKVYGEQAAAMAALEMAALARIMQGLDQTQRGNAAAVRSAFFLMRGIFLDGKKWDTTPDGKGY